jgi:ABC-2 type transport system ATP-binding protein
MDEAERLCDRLALIDSGRLVALDTPAGFVDRLQAGQRLRFRPSAPFEDGLLAGLPDVSGLARAGQTVVVSGTGHLVQAVTGALARQRIVPNDLRVEQATLDDAFVALTGHTLERA